MERRILASTRTHGGCDLRLIEYAAGVRQAPHRHERGSITLVLRGALVEGSNAGSETAAALSVVAKRAGWEHDNAFGVAGATTLQIELPKGAGVPEREPGPFATWDHAGPASRHLLRLVALVQSGAPVGDAGDALIRAALGQLPHRGSCPGPPLDWLMQAREALAAEATSIAVLARRAGVHPVYFARRFRAHFGLSPGAWRRRARLHLAAAALLETQGALAEVALEAGYFDQPHMNREILSATGMTPGMLRRVLAAVPHEGFNRTRIPRAS